MEIRQIKSNEISEEAYNIYINSDFVIWQDGLDYYYSDYASGEKHYIGNLKDVAELLESFVEESED